MQRIGKYAEHLCTATIQLQLNQIPMKNSKTIQQTWRQQKAILKAKFLALTEADFEYEDGRGFDFINTIVKIGKGKNIAVSNS